MKIVIKIGTQSILSNDGTPIESVMLSLVEQISKLQQSGYQVILVSSGAVGSGRKIIGKSLKQELGNTIGEKQVLASLGQPQLMQIYMEMFQKHNLLVSQLLLTKQDFHTRQHYLNIARVLNEILRYKTIIPIINENDTVSIEELMFTDNDELAGLIAAQSGANKLIILSNVEGVYNGHPNDDDSKLISIIDPEKGWPNISSFKSTYGRGGMISKINTARKMSNLGITTHITSMNQSSVILRILENEAIGTTILPLRKKSNIKKWMAFNVEQKNNLIFINKCLYEILKENKRVISILPIGIESFDGIFKKGDVIDVIAPDGKKIGTGIAKYDNTKLSEFIGIKGKPAFIHYDHFYIL